MGSVGSREPTTTRSSSYEKNNCKADVEVRDRVGADYVVSWSHLIMQSVIPREFVLVGSSTTNSDLSSLEKEHRRVVRDLITIALTFFPLLYRIRGIVLRQVDVYLVLGVTASLPYALPFAKAVEMKFEPSGTNLIEHLRTAISSGNTPFVKYVLVEKGPIDITHYPLQHYCEASCCHGHLDITQLLYEKFPSHFSVNKHCADMFIEACINGHTEVASWLRDAVSFSMESLPGSEPKIPAHELLSNVCFQGHNQTAKWLRGLGFTLTSFDVSSIKSWALSSGRMEMVKWLIETFPSSKAEYIPRYLVCCCKTADVDSFEWILQKMPAICDADMDISEIFQTLAERNSFEMAQHVLKRLKNGRFLQPAASTKCFGLICRQGNIEFAEWFNSQFSQHDRQQKHHLEFVHEGLASGNLAACQWIIKTFNIPEPFDVTKEEILLLCSKHHVEIVHWISTFPSFQELLPSEKCSAFAAVASTWDLEFTKWMALQCSHSVDSESSLLQNELNRLITSSCLAGNLSFLQWLCDDFTFDEATIQLCAITAFSSGKLEIIDWILHDYIPNKAPPSSSLSQSLHPTTPEGNTLVKKTLMHCCRHSDLERAKSLANVFHITADEVRYNSNLPLVICCTSGFVDMAQWLFENFLQLSDLDDVEPYVKQQCVATGNMSGSLWLRSKLSSFKSGS